MIAATILMIISLIFNHFIIPRSNQVRLQFEEKYYRNAMSVSDYHAEFPGHQVAECEEKYRSSERRQCHRHLEKSISVAT